MQMKNAPRASEMLLFEDIARLAAGTRPECDQKPPDWRRFAAVLEPNQKPIRGT